MHWNPGGESVEPSQQFSACFFEPGGGQGTPGTPSGGAGRAAHWGGIFLNHFHFHSNNFPPLHVFFILPFSRLRDLEVLEARRPLVEKVPQPPPHNHHTPSLSPQVVPLYTHILVSADCGFIWNINSKVSMLLLFQNLITTSQSDQASWTSVVRTRDRDSFSTTIGTWTSSSWKKTSRLNQFWSFCETTFDTQCQMPM